MLEFDKYQNFFIRFILNVRIFYKISLYKINFLIEFLVAEVCMKIIKIIYNEKYIILQYIMKN